MFTRCPHCSATFRVTASILQMAEGEVRCGACSAVFNALHTLLDDWTGADLIPADAPRLAHPDELSPAATPPPAAEATTVDPTSETLEFDVPETEWQRYFISAPEPAPEARIEPALGADFAALDPQEPALTPPVATAGEPSSPNPPAPVRSLDEETADTDTWQAFLREVERRPDTGTDTRPGMDATASADTDPAGAVDAWAADAEDGDDIPAFVLGSEESAPAHHPVLVRTRTAAPDAAEIVPAAAGAAGGTPADAPAPEPVTPPEDTDDAAAESEPESESGPDAWPAVSATAAAAPTGDDSATVLDWGPAFPAPRASRPAHGGRWLAASLMATLLLGGQLLHHWRDRLAADPAWGGTVRAIYARLGLPLYPAWPLAAYEIRSVKAIADSSAPGALDIVAEVAVGGSRPVGLPMVRVVLRDRWSNTVASGVFDASRYLAEAMPADENYAPGTLIPMHITLTDPGTAAQGYELDVCIPDRLAGLQCKAAGDPFR